jgi:hypothetical protein
MELKLNMSFALHCIVCFIINRDLLYWDGIYLYLITANKILTNFKSNVEL